MKDKSAKIVQARLLKALKALGEAGHMPSVAVYNDWPYATLYWSGPGAPELTIRTVDVVVREYHEAHPDTYSSVGAAVNATVKRLELLAEKDAAR